MKHLQELLDITNQEKLFILDREKKEKENLFNLLDREKNERQKEKENFFNLLHREKVEKKAIFEQMHKEKMEMLDCSHKEKMEILHLVDAQNQVKNLRVQYVRVSLINI